MGGTFVKEFANGLAEGISKVIIQNPEYLGNILYYTFILIIVWIIGSLTKVMIGLIRPSVGYKTHDRTLGIIEKHIAGKKK